MNRIIGLVCTLIFTSSVWAGDASIGKTKVAVCAGCHGADGNSALEINPSLAGQNEKYIAKQLRDFKSGARVNASMSPMANMVSDEDIEHVAAFYASQSIQHGAVADEFIKLGESLYRAGDSDRDIPACMACHGANGNGMSAAGFPAISGQKASYTKAQLEAFRSGKRDNDANNVMRDIVAKMSDQQIEALANYLVGLH